MILHLRIIHPDASPVTRARATGKHASMLVRLVGYAGIALFAFGLVAVLALGGKPERIRQVKAPMLAMEFVDSEPALQAIIGAPGSTDPADLDARRWLSANLRFDYGFIVLYWLLFVLIAGVMAQRDGRWMPWLGAAAALAITGAALFDVLENVRMTRVIQAVQLAGTDVASAGFAKWLLSFVAIGLLSFAFWGRGGWVWSIGVVCVAIAVVGVAGLVALRMGAGGIPLVNLAFSAMMLALLPMAVLAFTVSRSRFAG
jgi:hypothetical protein